jgi:hypothetical protein
MGFGISKETGAGGAGGLGTGRVVGVTGAGRTGATGFSATSLVMPAPFFLAGFFPFP